MPRIKKRKRWNRKDHSKKHYAAVFALMLLVLFLGTLTLYDVDGGSITGALIGIQPDLTQTNNISNITLLIENKTQVIVTPPIDLENTTDQLDTQNNEPTEELEAPPTENSESQDTLPTALAPQGGSFQLQEEFSIQAAPTISSLILNTTTTTNRTQDNVTAYWTTADTDGDPVKNITNWYLNGTSTTVQNLPFENISDSEFNATKDYSSFSNNVSERGGALFNATGGYDGKGAFEFDGSNDYLYGELNLLDQDIDESFTIEMWVKPTGAQSNEGIFQWAEANTPASGNPFVLIQRTSSTTVRFYVDADYRQTVTVNDDEWTHLAVSYDGSTWRFYNNSQAVGTYSDSAPNNEANGDYVYYGVGFSSYFLGTIDDAKIHNITLTDEQIENIYNNKTHILDASQTSVGDVWNISVTPNDGTSDGTTVFSQGITIQDNQLPVVSNLNLNSTNLALNNTNQNLTANWDVSDGENDFVKNITSWYLNESPIALVHLPFEQVNDTRINATKDYSGFDHNASEHQGVTWNSDGGYDGKGAFTFDGSNDYMTVPVPEPSLPFTIAFWVNSSDGNPIGIFDSAPSQANVVRNWPSGKVEWHSGCPSVTLGLSANSWTHLSFTYSHDGTDRIIDWYKNGVAQTSQTCTAGNTLAWSNFRLGDINSGASGRFSGQLDEFIIFNRSLSPEQVLNLYNNRTDLLDANETSVGDVWNISVTPNDGTSDGTTVFSESITILGNQIPVASNVVLNSTDITLNNTNQNLTAYWDVSDAEGGFVKNITNWYLNGTSITVLHMPFEKVDDSAINATKDYSGFDNNGSEFGPTWNATGGYDGKGAYEFDGVDDYIDLGNPLSFPNETAPRTTCAWAKTDNISGLRKIVSYGTDNNDEANQISLSGTTLFGGGHISGIAVSNFWTVDDWNHICLTYNGSHAALYANSSLIEGPTVTNFTVTSNKAYIGRHVTDSEYWHGTIDEVLIFNRSLSPEQIQLIYNNQTGLLDTNETSVGDVWNISVTPNDGTADGATIFSENITIESDITAPQIIDYLPSINSVYNVSNTISTAVNVTDEIEVAQVFANFSFPNGTIEQIQLSFDVGDRFTNNFTVPALVGDYNITFIANDTSGNIINNETSNFTVNDILNPNVTSLLPLSTKSYLQNQKVSILTNVTDDVDVSTVQINLTYPDSLRLILDLSYNSTSGLYEYDFTGTSQVGQYNITVIANDTSLNQNNSETTFFTVNDSGALVITNMTPTTTFSINQSTALNISANVSGTATVSKVTANISKPNGIIDQIVLINSTNVQIYSLEFDNTSLAGIYNITFIANSSLNNRSFGKTYFTVNDIQEPSILDLGCFPSAAGLNATVICNTTVTDNIALSSVAANVTHPNGTVRAVSILNSGSNYYFTYNDTPIIKEYNVSWQALDTSSNSNTTTAQFNITQPAITNLGCEPNPANISNGVVCSVNVTTAYLVYPVDSINASLTFPNQTERILTVSNKTTVHNITFSQTDIPGNYRVHWQANDSINTVANHIVAFNVNDVIIPSVQDVSPVINTGFNETNVFTIALNSTDDVSISQAFANVTFPNSTVQEVELEYDTNNRYNNTFTAPTLYGDYTVTFSVNDTSDNVNSTESTNFTVNVTDIDNDGVSDLIDSLIGNSTSLNYSGFTPNVTVGDSSTNGTFQGQKNVLVYNNTSLLLNITHNFSLTGLDLRNISVNLSESGVIANVSGQQVTSKTLYLEDKGYNALCAKDSEIDSLADISSDCTGVNETNLNSCVGVSAGIQSGSITCYDLGSWFRVENLSHSALRGSTTSSSSSSSGGSGSSGGSSSSGGGGSGCGPGYNLKEGKCVLIEKKQESTKAECTEDDQCPRDTFCLKGKCTRYECSTNKECPNNEYCINHQCFKIFDLKVKKVQRPIYPGSDLTATIFVKSMSEQSGDIKLTYWIEKNGKEVVSGSDIIFVDDFESKDVPLELTLPSKLPIGLYQLKVELQFEDYIIKSHKTIEVIPNVTNLFGKALSTGLEKVKSNYFIVWIVVMVVLVILFLTLVVARKRDATISSTEILTPKPTRLSGISYGYEIKEPNQLVKKPNLKRSGSWAGGVYVDLQGKLDQINQELSNQKDTPKKAEVNALKIEYLKETKPKNAKDLEQWVLEMRKRGITDQRMKNILSQSHDLTPREIRRVIRKADAVFAITLAYNITSKRIKELKEFIQDQDSKGLTEDQIIQELKSQGWDEGLITSFVHAYSGEMR